MDGNGRNLWTMLQTIDSFELIEDEHAVDRVYWNRKVHCQVSPRNYQKRPRIGCIFRLEVYVEIVSTTTTAIFLVVSTT